MRESVLGAVDNDSWGEAAIFESIDGRAEWWMDEGDLFIPIGALQSTIDDSIWNQSLSKGGCRWVRISRTFLDLTVVAELDLPEHTI